MLLSFASPEERRQRATAHPKRYALTKYGLSLVCWAAGLCLLYQCIAVSLGFLAIYFLVGCVLFTVATWRRRELSRQYLGALMFSGIVWPVAALLVIERNPHDYRYYGVLDMLRDYL